MPKKKKSIPVLTPRDFGTTRYPDLVRQFADTVETSRKENSLPNITFNINWHELIEKKIAEKRQELEIKLSETRARKTTEELQHLARKNIIKTHVESIETMLKELALGVEDIADCSWALSHWADKNIIADDFRIERKVEEVDSFIDDQIRKLTGIIATSGDGRSDLLMLKTELGKWEGLKNMLNIKIFSVRNKKLVEAVKEQIDSIWRSYPRWKNKYGTATGEQLQKTNNEYKKFRQNCINYLHYTDR